MSIISHKQVEKIQCQYCRKTGDKALYIGIYKQILYLNWLNK